MYSVKSHYNISEANLTRFSGILLKEKNTKEIWHRYFVPKYYAKFQFLRQLKQAVSLEVDNDVHLLLDTQYHLPHTSLAKKQVITIS